MYRYMIYTVRTDLLFKIFKRTWSFSRAFCILLYINSRHAVDAGKCFNYDVVSHLFPSTHTHARTTITINSVFARAQNIISLLL